MKSKLLLFSMIFLLLSGYHLYAANTRSMVLKAGVEFDVDELARRFDKYPNLAADLAGRICHLQVQDRQKVRKFFIKYQDRLLYGTDNIIGGWSKAPLDERLSRFAQVYELDYRYFATDGQIEASDVARGYMIKGLALPAVVVKKLYYQNALRWFPGLMR